MNKKFISVVTDDGIEHTIRVAGTTAEPHVVGVYQSIQQYDSVEIFAMTLVIPFKV